MTISIRILLLVGLVQFSAMAKPLFDHIEPMNWFSGMQKSQFQIMLHGDQISEYQIAVHHHHVTFIKADKTDNPNYLFVTLKLNPNFYDKGFNLSFQKNGKTIAQHFYPILRKQNSASKQSFSAKDVIYLITPDRFANGDKQNDSLASYQDKLNRQDINGRHGGDIQGIINHLDYLANMGFSQIWSSPLLENAQPKFSYHGYAITDFYRIDPRFGSNKLYKTLSDEARKRGIGLIQDVVLNHCGSGHWWLNDIPSKTWFNPKYDAEQHFMATNHMRTTLHDPHAAESDRKQFTKGWFVETMPDLNQNNELLANYLIQNTLWWIETANLSGLRVDTYSYSEPAFLARWSKRISEEYPQMNIVGEEWATNPAIVSYWQKGKQNNDGYQSYMPSMMDFPLEQALINSLLHQETWSTGLVELYQTLADDFQYADASNLVIFADNHDMSRALTQLNNDIDLYKMALTVILTTRGIPQIYYGSEIGFSNPNSTAHGEIRQEMLGGWQDHRQNAFTGKLNNQQQALQTWLKNLIQWRKTSDAIANGKLVHFAPKNGVYVYFRQSKQQNVMVVLNKNTKATKLDLSRFKSQLNGANKAKVITSGETVSLTQNLTIAAKSAMIFEL